MIAASMLDLDKTLSRRIPNKPQRLRPSPTTTAGKGAGVSLEGKILERVFLSELVSLDLENTSLFSLFRSYLLGQRWKMDTETVPKSGKADTVEHNDIFCTSIALSIHQVRQYRNI